MKADTTQQYLYSGDYYSYKVVTSADGTTTNNVYVTNPSKVFMQLSVNLFGELVIASQSKMQINGYLSNVLDANKEEIYTGGKWKIIQTAPILGPMGLKAGYQYRAELIEGQI